MTRRFTKILAAVALLVGLTIPLGMWGQSRESITASYGWEDADDASQWTISSAIVKTSGQGNTGTYAGKINTNTTTVQYNDKVNVTSFSYALKRTSTNSNYSVYIQTSTDGQTWNTVDTHAMSSFGNGTYTTVTKTFDGNTAYFVRFYCNNTTATRYVDDVTIVYNTTASTTFTVNYDCNGGETDCPENVSGIAPGTSITLASAPSRQHYNFVGWTYGATTYNPGDSYTVNSNVTFIAQWEPDGTYGEGSICFSSQSSCTVINSQSVTGEDDLGNTWTITTVGTSSFTSNSGYYQVGSGNSPATSITFTTTLDEEVNVTDFSATFGGFNATRASVALKVDNTQVGSGTLNGGDDVTVSSSSAQIGTTLTVIVTPTAGGVKCYNISYAYETIDNPAVATTTTINVPQNFNTDIYQGKNAGTLTATVKDNENNTISGATVTWESSNPGVATIDANGAVTLVAVGTTTITASYAGVEDEYRPSEGTYELTVTDSNAPGTQNNPYTVAQAIAATPSSGNVYIQGVVSSFYNTSIVGDGSNYRYYISDDGTTTTQLLVYKGKGLNQATFTNADDLLVGDEVVIYGTLTMYQNAPEINSGNYLYSWNRPTYPIINANDINLTYDATSGSIAYSITNPTGATLTATSTADWISNIIVGSESLTFTTTANEGNEDRSATITLSYEGAADKAITVTQAHYVPDYATLPFAYDGNGTGTLPAGFTCYDLDTYSSSPKMQFNTTGDWAILKINERPGILTFDIKGNGFSGGTFKVQTSENGTTYTDLATYNYAQLGSNTLNEEFDNLGENVRYIKWIYTEKVSGNVGLGNIALAKYVAPNPYDLTVTLNDNINAIYVFNAADQNNPLIAGGAAGTVQVLERTSIMISPDVDEDCVLTSLMVNNQNVIDQLDGSGAYTFTMPSQNVTISATAMVTTTYTLATTIESGRHYIITNGNDRAMGAQSMSGTSQGNNRTAVEIYINLNDVAQVTSPDVFEFVINGPDANGFYTIYDAEFPGYLYAAGSTSSNHMKTQTFCDNRGQWSISFDEDNAANIVANFSGNNARNTMRYNENNDIFSCYASGNQDPIYLYVKDNDTNYEFYKDIVGHTTTSGWNFIASPVGTAPTNMNALSDLYFYDEDDSYWRNKKVADNAEGFGFSVGTGYLAASSNNITLSFSGTSIITAATYQIPLSYSGETNPLAGWNLVGNPFNCNATLNMDCYTISGMAINTQAHTPGNYTVAPCEGVMVKATAGNQTVTFTKATQGQAPQINQLEMTVAQQVMSRGTATSMVHDNAIVNFNAGSQLEKFPFNADAAELYIPQNGKEYAIVSSDAQGEMPVNFKAKENGTYTLSIDVEGMEMNYLHLIDNKTGNDVDLLQTPSYSFEAKTTDYESRFKLVFVANNEESVSAGSETFAFFSNGSFVINNEGNAELQVIDINGRIVKSESINGCANVNVNAAPGVYMLRLVNGDNVKVQKVVVK